MKVKRVRIRANAFHCTNTQERKVPWSFKGAGTNPLVLIDGKNFEISDNDFWATWTMLKTGTAMKGTPTTARYGIIQRNTFWNGGACHWFNQAKQIIFEVWVRVRVRATGSIKQLIFEENHP